MAQTSSTIKLIFDGSERGVVAAAAKASAAIRGLDDSNSRLSKSASKAEGALLGISKGMLALSAANTAVKVIGGTVGALQQLAPIALLLPGALAGGAAAMGTFKVATAGMGDALKAGLSGDMEKFAEATKGMAPEMQAAAKAVSAFKPQIDDLKKTVQGNFWAGFSADITKLGNTYLPIFKAGMGGIASEFNLAGKQVLAFLKSAQAIGSINNILNQTRDAFGSMRGVLTNVVSGFLQLANVGANFLPRLSAGIQTASEKFAAWAKSIAASGQLEDMINGAIQGFKDLGGIVVNVGSILGSVFTGLGGVVESPLARIRELTAQIAEFMKTAAAQDGLRALGETLQVVGDVVGRVVLTAFKELAPTLVALAPVAQEVARTLGDLLVQALQVLGPLIRGVADVFNAFPGSASVATVAVVGFVAAIKTIKAVNAVTDLLGLASAFGGAGDKAKDADGKVRGFAGGLGLIKGALAVGAVAAIAVEIDKVNTSAAGSAENLQGFERNLHNIVGAAGQLASGDISGIFADIRAQVEATNATWKAGEAPAQQWSLAVSRAATDAATSVQNFFRGLVGLPPLPPINIDANTDPAQSKVDGWVGGVSRTRGTAALDADKAPADGKVGDWVGGVSRTRGTATLDANPGPANTQLGGWQGRANATTGTSQLNANPAQANGQVTAWQGNANRATGTATLDANPARANAQIQSLVTRWNGYTININAVVSSRVGGLAHGGPVYGPGTGTSDTAGLFALSKGEHVLTAREVAAAGGHAAIFKMRRALAGGRVPRMTATRGRAASGGSVNSAGALSIPTPQVAVSVHIGNQEITDIVRTQIATSNRQTRRTVGMGAGTTF